jgi:hypothetical protein
MSRCDTLKTMESAWVRTLPDFAGEFIWDSKFVYSGAPEARYVYRYFRNSAPAPEERHINGIICHSSRAGAIC